MRLRRDIETRRHALPGEHPRCEGDRPLHPARRRVEIWEPRFVFHGFRFVEVTGYPGKPGLSSIEGKVVNDDLETAGEFACSNDTINAFFRNITWACAGTIAASHRLPAAR